MAGLDEIRSRLRGAAPDLVGAVFDQLAPKLIPATAKAGSTSSKDFNDPIWRIVTFDGPELDVVGLPLIQRLRRIRQLGFGFLVYPSAQHSRFEHSLGAAVAATRMFDQVAKDAEVIGADNERLLKTVRLAALLHDSGHTVFSHVGERVLGHLFGEEFQQVGKELLDQFPDPLVSNGSGSTSTAVSDKAKKAPAPAETVAVLLLLSEAMQHHLARCGAIGGLSVTGLIINTAALILGRPQGLRCGRKYHHWIKSIVSGDVDADKLDYIARDAYFAGLPVSADVHRLVSQMASARFPTDQMGDALVEGSRVSDLEQFRVLAVRPSAVSALEMLVLTRSYMFERLYAHHKTRAAERELEWVLQSFLRIQQLDKAWSPAQVLNFLYTSGGDDAILQTIASHRSPDFEEDEVIRRKAVALLDRDLPCRAIAIMNKASVDREVTRGTSAVKPWQLLETYFSQFGGRKLQEEIGNLAGLNWPTDLIVDPPPGVPITEDPEIFVAKTGSDSIPDRVNRHFDAEQLSNAYRDVKRVAWVFCRPEHAEIVAAATAIVLQRKFDFVVTREAVHRAKVSYQGYSDAILKLAEKASLTPLEAKNLLSSDSADHCIYAAPNDMEAAAAELPTPEHRKRAQDVLSQGLIAAKLPRAYRSSYYLSLTIYKELLAHARSVWRSADFAQAVPRQNEARFQKHLMAHLNKSFPEHQGYRVTEHTAENGGYTDIVVARSASPPNPSPHVVIELKSAEEEFDKLARDHAGQASQYTELRNSPVSILYCQFKTDGAMHLVDTIEVRTPQTIGSTLVVLTLGTRGFSGPPSDGGKTNLIGPSPSAPS